MECSISGCIYPLRNKKRRLCNRHYLKFRRKGDPLWKPVRVNGGKCSIEDCNSIAETRTWCVKHYDRWKTKGSPYRVLIPHELHGLHDHELYSTWQHIKNRCYNTNSENYKYYGGRGIKMCDSWRKSFSAFLNDVGERPSGTTLDRIDNNGNYEPTNVRWATSIQQSFNRGLGSNNASGFKGVSYDKRLKLWRAYIGGSRSRVELGRYKLKRDAIKARKQAEKIHIPL